MRRRALPVLVLAVVCAGCGEGTSGPQSREVAQWVTSVGGKVKLAGRDVLVSQSEAVPEGEFRIERIDLNQTQVRDKGLEKLKPLTNLDYLGLHSTNVTDRGLDHILGLTTLKELELSNTRITDKALEKIAANLPDLQKLYLYNTAITKEGLDRLKEQRPDLTVYADPPARPAAPQRGPAKRR